MAHGDAREGKWRGKMRMEWVVSSSALYVGTRSIQLLSADPHSSTASSRLNWDPRRFKWARPFRRMTKSVFCAYAITFKLASTYCMCTLYLKTWKSREYWNPQLYILALCVFDVPLAVQHVSAFESFRCGVACLLRLCASLSLINLAFPTASCNTFSILFIYLSLSLRLCSCFSLYPQG